jgi:Phage gp6-like head-tail connector protein
MGYCRQTSLPSQEPVLLQEMKQWLRIPAAYVDDDSTLAGLIQAAREVGEVYTGRALAQRTFSMVLDSHPYYTDTIQSQLAYPPSYYSLPRWATTLWNYSQMIKLPFPPVISVQGMVSVNPDGSTTTMAQDTDFILDRMSEPARIFPIPGSYWPADLYVANALQINFTAGYDPAPSATDSHAVAGANPGQQPDSVIVSGVPQTILVAMKQLVAYWYENRGSAGDVPANIANAFYTQAVLDFAPTRG